MSPPALRLTGVKKRYGKHVALDGLDLEVPRGTLFGLVGPNGAGKTTTFGIVSGAVRADAGEIDVLARGPFDPARHAGRVGVLPQDAELHPESSARTLLAFFAMLQGMSRKDARREADRLLELVSLSDRADARVRHLSHGMRRRLAVAQALAGDPELVLLDEPTGGLDPHLVVDMREVLRAERGRRTLVVSTHILADLEQTCDHVAFMEAGRVTTSGPLAEVTKRARLVRVELAEPIAIEGVADLLDGRDPEMDGDALVYAIHDGEDPAAVQGRILPALIERGARVLEVRLGQSLESAYLTSRAKVTSRA